MSQLISGIASGAPIWVWPLLLVLILVGIRASRDRTAPVYIYYGLPLLAIMSLNTIMGQPNPTIAWICFGLGYLLGCATAFSMQSNWLIERNDTRLSLKGEWVTLITMMVIFWSNFVNGMLLDVAPNLQTIPVFTAAFTLVIGLASGTFLGRALYILRS